MLWLGSGKRTVKILLCSEVMLWGPLKVQDGVLHWGYHRVSPRLMKLDLQPSHQASLEEFWMKLDPGAGPSSKIFHQNQGLRRPSHPARAAGSTRIQRAQRRPFFGWGGRLALGRRARTDPSEDGILPGAASPTWN